MLTGRLGNQLFLHDIFFAETNRRRAHAMRPAWLLESSIQALEADRGHYMGFIRLIAERKA